MATQRDAIQTRPRCVTTDVVRVQSCEVYVELGLQFAEGAMSESAWRAGAGAGIGMLSVDARKPLSGWVFKLGEVRKSWKRRWFVLAPSRNLLLYYKSDAPNIPATSAVDLRECRYRWVVEALAWCDVRRRTCVL